MGEVKAIGMSEDEAEEACPIALFWRNDWIDRDHAAKCGEEGLELSLAVKEAIEPVVQAMWESM